MEKCRITHESIYPLIWVPDNFFSDFQFYNLVAGLTAVQNVALVTDIADNPLERVEALRLVDLDGRKNHYPSQRSGGEKQRVAIARAIGNRLDVLLCDEPTAALDVKTGIFVLAAIASIRRQQLIRP